jgi:hypothetical protein
MMVTDQLTDRFIFSTCAIASTIVIMGGKAIVLIGFQRPVVLIFYAKNQNILYKFIFAIF